MIKQKANSSGSTKRIVLIAVACVLCLIALTLAALAYYEYYGQYSSILTLEGNIRLDAFDVLYEELRSTNLGYGTTPENPYVIDSVRRLQNLIKLNNSGRLHSSKVSAGIDKYYFCLEFDQQELPQVLDLLNEGLFSTVGNNDFPFEDELAGIVYAYEIEPGTIVYYSGCLDTVEVTIQNGNICRDGEDTGIAAGENDTPGTYLKLNRTYAFDGNGEIMFTGNTEYLPMNRFVVVHQMIANATIVADLDQVDVGFFSQIASGGDVHDIILYNTSIVCREDNPGDVHGRFFTLFADLLNDTTGSEGALADHNTAQSFAEADYRDERHIGIFAGHIDGSAANISIGGYSSVTIDTKEINYYSQYTTVGFISDSALIGGVEFQLLLTDMEDENGNVSGCMFADFIYSSAVDNGLQAGQLGEVPYYLLTSIEENVTHNWGGVDENVGNGVFTYGSFHFLLSSGSEDTVNALWANKGESTLLYEAGYNIYQSVLYCVDEYRYSNGGTPTGALVNGAASVDESKYSSISELESTGSVLDAGKYLITAYVNLEGVDHYYALKLSAESVGDSIVCSFDTTDECDVTGFITSNDTSTTIYSSALWTIDTASETPTFENSRFEGNFLKWIYESTGHTADIDVTSNSAQKTSFIYSSSSNAFYFEQEYELAGGGFGTYRYYLTYNYETGTWSMTSTPGAANTTSCIKLYKVSNGYTVKLVEDLAELLPNNDYVIVAHDNANNKYRLLGIDAELDSETEQWLIGSGIAGTDMTYDTMPTSVSVEEYDLMQNYIWYTESAANGDCTFTDRISTEYGLLASNSLTVSAAAPTAWTYSVSNHSLVQNGNYLTYSYLENASGFGIGNVAGASIYIYHLVAEDSDPQYITYDGAKYIRADSTLLKAGEYVISIEYNNNHLALTNTTGTTVTTTSINVGSWEAPNSQSWVLASDSSSCVFKNQATGNNLTLNGKTAWHYDAANHYFYYEESGTKRYLSYNGSAISFTDNVGSATNVNVYQVELESTYTGVSLIGATLDERATLEQGSYAIILEYNNQNYALRNQSGTTLSTTQVTIGNFTPANNQTWNLNATGSSCTFRNASTNNSLTLSNNTTWYYDAANHTLYYLNNGSFTFLSFNGSSVTTTTTVSSAAKVKLYKISNGLNLIESTAYYYFISTQPIDDTTKNPYLVGTNGDYSGIKYTAMYGQYTYNAGTLTTRMDLDLDMWRLRLTAGKVNSFPLYEFYNNKAYSKSGAYIYLAANNNASNRQLTIHTVENYYTMSGFNSGSNVTGFVVNRPGNAYPYMLGFRGSGKQYFMYAKDNATSIASWTNGSTSTTPNTPTADSAPVYTYCATGRTQTKVLALVSSDGDALDEGIHYLFAADVSNEYYALSYSAAESSYYAEKVTSFISPIIEAGDNGYIQKTSVPVNSDWCQTQLSTDIRLQFYHTQSSTVGSLNYLDAVNPGPTLTITTIAQGATNSIYWYYDLVNQILRINVSGTDYYVTFNAGTETFGLDSTKANASKLVLIRYTPTYTVTQVTSFGEDELESGVFIIAGHSAEGFTATGTNGTTIVDTNITNYLTTELSEADYKSIFNYLFEQTYYGVNANENYSDDAANGSIKFQMSALSGLGSVRVNYGTKYFYIAQASSTTWVVKPSSTAGLWNLVINGQTDNNYYMQFKGNTTSPKLQISDPAKTIGSYIGGYEFSLSSAFNANSGNIYLYDTNGNKVTLPATNGGEYLIVAECADDVKVILGNNNGTIAQAYYPTTNTADSKYRWTVTTTESGFLLSNNGYYAYVNSNGSWSLQNAVVSGYFRTDVNYLIYRTVATTKYVPYRTGNSTLGVQTDATYTAKLYIRSDGGYNQYVYTPVTAGNITGSNRYLIVGDGTNYYGVRIRNNNNTAFSVTLLDDISNTNGTLTTSTNLSTTNYPITVTEQNGNYALYGTNGQRYLTISNNSVGRSQTATYNPYDFDDVGIHYAVTSTANYAAGMTATVNSGFTAVGSLSGEAAGSMVIIYKYDNATGTYYNIGLDGPDGTPIANDSDVQLNVGDRYIMFVRDSNNIYHLVGYDPSHTGRVVMTEIGSTIALEENTVQSNHVLTAVATYNADPDYEHAVSLKFAEYTSGNLYLSLNSAGTFVEPSTTITSYWEYGFNSAHTYLSRLFTVVQASDTAQSLMVSGSVVTRGSAETYLYSYDSATMTLGSVQYTLNAAGNYVIVIFHGGNYYLVRHAENYENDYSVVPYLCGSGIPSSVTEDDIWTFSTVTNGYRVSVPGHSDCHLRFGSSQSLNVSYEPGISTNTRWTYTAGSSSGVPQFNETSGSTEGYSSLGNGFSKDLYIFKVSMNSGLDKLSDTKTSLGYKTLVKASLNTTGAAALTMVAQVGSGASAKYYTLAMNDPENIKTMDITDVMKEGLAGNAVFLFDAAVWSNLGQDYTLVFDNKGLSASSSLHLLSSDQDYLNEGRPTSPEVPADGDLSKYTWSLQTFSSGGDSLYLYGYQDPQSNEGVYTYVYFDATDLTFKTTTSSVTALTSGKYVQLYQLGRKQTVESGYQTLEISLKDDGITITTFPLNEVGAEDVQEYTPGGQNSQAEGEYMILTLLDGSYYALTYNSSGNLAMADVSLLFNGHFDSRGDLGTYCISVNKRYLWKQTATPVIGTATASSLTFQNIGTNTNLSLQSGDNSVLTFTDATTGQLYSTVNGTDYYLNFTTAGGYSVSTTPSLIPIRLFAVGANSLDTGDDSGSLQYVYYNYGLNTGSTSGINFNNFSFAKESIPELQRYAMDYEGSLVPSQGWTLIGDTTLTEVNSTVWFKDGITISENFATMVSNFHEREYHYSFKNQEGEEIEGTVNYYAPEGAVSFAVADASPEKPVFVNVIASTEQEADYRELLRYLSIWKVASIDAENQTLTTLLDYDETQAGAAESTTNSAFDFAYSLSSIFYTPNFAIPLPNILSADKTTEGSASYVKIKSIGENDVVEYNPYWLSNNGENAPYEHLIAHTFTISSPGVYYLGSTAGSVSISYISIEDMMAGEEGEATGINISDRMTIDYVWGAMLSTASSNAFETDEVVGTLAYVLRKDESESLTWLHSNIYPFFTNGTAGLYLSEKPDNYNPTDELTLAVERTYTEADAENPAFSQVSITVTTTDAIYDDGNGVQYYNMNTATQRQTRRVSLAFPEQLELIEEGGE